MKILLAVDGSPYTKKMLAYLVTHDETFSAGNDYTLFTAVHPLPPRARSALGKEMADTYHVDESERVLAPVTKFLLRHGINAKSAWKVGSAGEAIAKFAESGKFDLVVMGSHGHGLFGNLVLGSVVTKVLAKCATPVLLIR